MMNKKVLLIPYPAQGHVNPILKLASILSNMGFDPILITPDFIHTRISQQIDPTDGIKCVSIPDGLDDETTRDFFSIELSMERNMALPLEDLVWEMNNDGGIAFLVVDLLASWAFDVGRRCGVQVAGFWPAMQATYKLVEAIPELVKTGVISENGIPRNQDSPIFLSPNDPTLSTSDLPWLIGSSTARKGRFRFWNRTLNRSKTLKWLLTNSFPEDARSKSKQSTMINASYNNSSKVLEIGPLLMQATTTIGNASFWEEDTTCLEWLDKQDSGSVVYISFGSWVSPIEEEKINSLALSLEASRRPFIWVLKPEWRTGLPEGYIERIKEQGRVVSWAPQLDVLRHHDVGCYLTHCGWNSTVEAIQCEKPLLCYPIAADQFLNCVYIVDAWKIGVKIGGFGFEEVDNAIRTVIEDEEVSRRIKRMNEKIFGKEGTSKAMANLKTFIRDVESSVST